MGVLARTLEAAESPRRTTPEDERATILEMERS